MLGRDVDATIGIIDDDREFMLHNLINNLFDKAIIMLLYAIIIFS